MVTIKDVLNYVKRRNKLFYSRGAIEHFGVCFISQGKLQDGVLYWYEKQDKFNNIQYVLRSLQGQNFKVIERSEDENIIINKLNRI